jgi:hypothetical protein
MRLLEVSELSLVAGGTLPGYDPHKPQTNPNESLFGILGDLQSVYDAVHFSVQGLPPSLTHPQIDFLAGTPANNGASITACVHISNGYVCTTKASDGSLSKTFFATPTGMGSAVAEQGLSAFFGGVISFAEAGGLGAGAEAWMAGAVGAGYGLVVGLPIAIAAAAWNTDVNAVSITGAGIYAGYFGVYNPYTGN